MYFNWIRVNTICPVLSLIWFLMFFIFLFFWSASHFPIFLANFDQRTMWCDLCCSCSKDSMKKILFETFIKYKSNSKLFDPYWLSISFINNPPVFSISNIFTKFELGTIQFDLYGPLQKSSFDLIRSSSFFF